MDSEQQVASTTPEQGAVTVLAAGESVQAEPAITMYTTSWCSDCVAAKRYLDMKGVTYVEVDIEADEGAAELVMSLNGGKRSVPTLVSEKAEEAQLRVVALALELGDDHDRQHHLVLGEPQQGLRVREQHRGVENVGSAHAPDATVRSSCGDPQAERADRFVA